jgi:Tfp pilus assembly protein PilO
MTVDIRPWKRLAAIWLPAVLLCVAAGGLFVWQTSESGGSRARVRKQVKDLEAELVRLESVGRAAAADRKRVGELEDQFIILYDEVFSSLDERLTRIMRAVGSATASAGLRPGAYTYSASEDRRTGFIRFGIRFSVAGEYRQIRQMLAEIQASPEFLVVEKLSLSGDEDPISRDLAMSVDLYTFLAEADIEQLKRLTGGTARPVVGEDG